MITIDAEGSMTLEKVDISQGVIKIFTKGDGDDHAKRRCRWKMSQ